MITLPIDIGSVVTAVAQAVPPMLPQVDIPSPPDFMSAVPLAAIVGADPNRLLRAAQSLFDDRVAITNILNDATPLIQAAGVDILDIGQRFLNQAAPLVPGLFTGPGAVSVMTRLVDLATEAFTAVAERLSQLESELQPLVSRLEGLVTAAAAREQLVATPANYAAETELRQLAGIEEEVVVAAEGAPEDVDTQEGDNAVGRAAVDAAKAQLGTPYVWGGSAPGGFDCSGLTSWAYKQAGVDIPRTAENQAVGRQVSYEELQPGDLVVWTGHVAMYAGDGQMIEAGSPVQMSSVRTDNIGMPFKGFWRPTG
ncbi:C40 family peptidase [Corynebacterium tuscaniense]|uniref:C40 family peptidase n=1 Tax=Corynebacterium tuscaniense TaxID=302449 RepID=UPI00050F6FAD|nr:C40 family peptidase [Corynebacterium tuscaniense]KGF22447.1 hypothetical protein HMPREF2129_07485 [Corynebacterium tuscaniense DNF00037]